MGPGGITTFQCGVKQTSMQLPLAGKSEKISLPECFFLKTHQTSFHQFFNWNISLAYQSNNLVWRFIEPSGLSVLA
jgi:hypothetical protein